MGEIEKIQHTDEDGSIYTAEIVPPGRTTDGGSEYGAKYRVDLIRESVDDHGLPQEQRLTVGRHNSWMEAEEHLCEVEDALQKEEIAGWGEDDPQRPVIPQPDWETAVTAVQNPYWRLDTLPVQTPGGNPLGHSVYMVVYDGVAHDQESVGSPAIPEGEPFRMLEVAHFKTTEAADRFGKEFKGYLMPGLLEGPELAEEVARLEGHPVEWKTLDGQEMKDYRDLKLTLIRNPVDWHPYNPNAEWDARIAAEGIYYDSIHDSTGFDETTGKHDIESTEPDFDL